MGIREGQIIEVISKQPFLGPLTIQVGKCKMTIGREMAHKILVEEIYLTSREGILGSSL